MFAATMLAPIGWALYQSLFKLQRSGLGLEEPTDVFAGLENYATALHDDKFLSSIVRVFMLAIVQVPIMLGLALALALLLDSRAAPLKRTFRLIYFLPYALPGVIAAIMWSFLYTRSTSPFTEPLQRLGLEVNFLSGELVLASIGNMITWGFTGYNMLILYSALQAIPSELHDAAAIDGCTGWRFAWYVKIPLVRPALVLTLLFSIIGIAQLFNDPAILQKVSPAVTAHFTPIMAVKEAADLNNYNYAAAQSIALAVLTFALSFTILKITQRKGSLT
ncbi:carbohydrate ABC transporter permease [Terrabacter sp. GCM10028922]|uniref:carbohydrate ABC transporter permease n=1 Tax=Terrabacter sp. GCM10028922 TaxID=3273428 RepID=UPI00362322CC